MAIVQFIRGVAVAAQSTPGTAAALSSPNWLNWVTSCKFTDQIQVDFPKFLHYQIWMEQQGIPLTRVQAWEVQFLWDTWQAGWFLHSFDGSPTGAGPYVFTPGKTAAKLLTIVKVNKNLTTYHQLVDGICTDLTLAYTANGLIKGTAKGVAQLAEPASSPPTPSYGVPGDKSPLQPGWAVVTINNVASRVITATMTLKQTVNPFYASPTSTVASPVGVAPSDWEVDDMSATLDIVRA